MVQVNIFESGNKSQSGKVGLFRSKFKVIVSIIGVSVGIILRIYSMVVFSLLIFFFPLIKNFLVGIYSSFKNIGNKRRKKTRGDFGSYLR